MIIFVGDVIDNFQVLARWTLEKRILNFQRANSRLFVVSSSEASRTWVQKTMCTNFTWYLRLSCLQPA